MNEFHIIFKSTGAVEVHMKKDPTICGYSLTAETADEVFFKHYHSSKNLLLKEIDDCIWGLKKIREAL